MADLRFKSWSASRLDDYTACPFMAMHKHLLKTCPMCFKGKLKGYPDQFCDGSNGGCGQPRKIAPAMARGGLIGADLEKYVNGEARTLTKEVRNPTAREIAKNLRTRHKLGAVKTEMQISFDRNFKVLGQGWSSEIWFIAKLDVWVVEQAEGQVIDWKTGGVDKNTGEIKAAAKYDDQLLSYRVAGLCAFPTVQVVNSSLCFVDAKDDPIVEDEAGPLKRKDLEKAKKKLVKLSLPIMSDTRFAPTSSYRCTYCDFAKRKGGPCKLGA